MPVTPPNPAAQKLHLLAELQKQLEMLQELKTLRDLKLASKHPGYWAPFGMPKNPN